MKRLRDDVDCRIEDALLAELTAIVGTTQYATHFVFLCDTLHSLRKRLKESLLKVDDLTTTEPLPPTPVTRDHSKQPVAEVLRTVRDEGWGVYGPAFPHNLERYAGLLASRCVSAEDHPLYGSGYTFKIELTDEGKRVLAENSDRGESATPS
jgi:hypothetical protein